MIYVSQQDRASLTHSPAVHLHATFLFLLYIFRHISLLLNRHRKSYGIYLFDRKVTAPIKSKMKVFPYADTVRAKKSLSEERIINYKPVCPWKNCKNIYIPFLCHHDCLRGNKERRKKKKRKGNEVSASVFFRLRYCKILLWSFSRRVTFRLIYRFWAKYFESQQKQPSLSLFRITTNVLRLGNSQRRSRLDIFGVLTKKGDLQLWA